MAYDVPTAAALKVKYPAFAAVADATVDAWIADAAATAVDTSWLETDYAPAIMAFAAHKLALQGVGEHAQATGYARQGITSLRSGSFGVSIDADVAKAASGGTLDATTYGQDYKRLLGANKGGPRVVGAGLAGGGSGTLMRQNNGLIGWPGY